MTRRTRWGVAVLLGVACSCTEGVNHTDAGRFDAGDSLAAIAEALDGADIEAATEALETAIGGSDAPLSSPNTAAPATSAGTPAASADPGLIGILQRTVRRSAAALRVVAGPRKDATGRLSVAGASAGFRRVDHKDVAFVEWRGGGVVRRLHVGRLKARLGEQLVLGRGFGAYPTAYTRSAAGRMTWSPSLSFAAGAGAAAAELGAGPWALRTIAVRSDGGGDVGWLAVGYESGAGRIGVAVGSALARPRLDASVASLHALEHFDDVEVSGELTRQDRDVFASARVAIRAMGAVTVFSAPVLASTDEPMVDLIPHRGRLRGAALEWGAFSRAALAGRVLLTAKASAGERQWRRQVWLTARRRRRGGWSIESLLYHTSRTIETLPREEAVLRVQPQREAHTRARLALELRDEHGTHRVRVDYLRNHGDGVLIGVGSRIAMGVLEVEWRIAAYALRSGQQGFISRPGPGPFELFSSVYGRGSDIALRVRGRLAPGLLLLGYYGRPYLKSPRVYIAAQLDAPKR